MGIIEVISTVMTLKVLSIFLRISKLGSRSNKQPFATKMWQLNDRGLNLREVVLSRGNVGQIDVWVFERFESLLQIGDALERQFQILLQRLVRPRKPTDLQLQIRNFALTPIL